MNLWPVEHFSYWSQVHLSEVTSYKIHTLVCLKINVYSFQVKGITLMKRSEFQKLSIFVTNLDLEARLFKFNFASPYGQGFF